MSSIQRIWTIVVCILVVVWVDKGKRMFTRPNSLSNYCDAVYHREINPIHIEAVVNAWLGRDLEKGQVDYATNLLSEDATNANIGLASLSMLYSTSLPPVSDDIRDRFRIALRDNLIAQSNPLRSRYHNPGFMTDYAPEGELHKVCQLDPSFGPLCSKFPWKSYSFIRKWINDTGLYRVSVWNHVHIMTSEWLAPADIPESLCLKDSAFF